MPGRRTRAAAVPRRARRPLARVGGGAADAATIGSSLCNRCSGSGPTGSRRPCCCPPASRWAASGSASRGSPAHTRCWRARSWSPASASRPSTPRRPRAWPGYVSGRERARGMSYFSVGGNAGFALGPVFVAPLVALFGLGASPLARRAGRSSSRSCSRSRFARLRAGRARRPRRRDGATVRRAPTTWGAFVPPRRRDRPSRAPSRSSRLQAFVPALLRRAARRRRRPVGDAAAHRHARRGRVGHAVGGVAYRPRRPARVLVLGSLVPLVLAARSRCRHRRASAAFALLALVRARAARSRAFSTTVVLGQELLPGRAGPRLRHHARPAIGARRARWRRRSARSRTRRRSPPCWSCCRCSPLAALALVAQPARAASAAHARALRVVERLARDAAADPLAEDLDRDLGARARRARAGRYAYAIEAPTV